MCVCTHAHVYVYGSVGHRDTGLRLQHLRYGDRKQKDFMFEANLVYTGSMVKLEFLGLPAVTEKIQLKNLKRIIAIIIII